MARDFILFGQPDVTVVVVDATRLERNLNLTLQILEITDRVVVALNLIDEADRHGLAINERLLAKDLGVPVVPMVARRGVGVDPLIGACRGFGVRGGFGPAVVAAAEGLGEEDGGQEPGGPGGGILRRAGRAGALLDRHAAPIAWGWGVVARWGGVPPFY